MTRTEKAAFRRLEKRHHALRSALRVIHVWMISPWCATDAENMCLRIANLVTQSLVEDETTERKEKRHG